MSASATQGGYKKLNIYPTNGNFLSLPPNVTINSTGNNFQLCCSLSKSRHLLYETSRLFYKQQFVK